MRVLGLDTTTRAGSVAIVEDDRVVFEERGDADRSHAERLPGDVVRALAAARLSTSDLDLFAVVSGPGSFTGLRIGIATVQGLAAVTGKRIVPVPTLAALAEGGGASLAPGSLVGTWMDAHRRDVFSALWRVGHGPPYALDRIEEIDAPVVDDPASVLARWRDGDGFPAVIVGDGAEMYASLIGASARVLPPPPLASVAARIALARARAGRSVDPAGVQPTYIRRPDAEIGREAVERKAQEVRARGTGG